MAYGGIRKFEIKEPVYNQKDFTKAVRLDLEVDVDLKALQAKIPLYYGPSYYSYPNADPDKHIKDVIITGAEIQGNKYDDHVARITKTVYIDPKALPPKALKIGGWLQEYYDGKWWNIGCNFPCKYDTVYIAKGDSTVTAEPSKSSVAPGETITIRATLNGDVDFTAYWHCKVILDDGTVLKDWFGFLVSSYARNYAINIPVTIPNKPGKHKVYALIGYHDYYEYANQLSDYNLWKLKSAAVSSFATFDLEITETTPQLDPGVYDSQITDAFW